MVNTKKSALELFTNHGQDLVVKFSKECHGHWSGVSGRGIGFNLVGEVGWFLWI